MPEDRWPENSKHEAVEAILGVKIPENILFY